MSIGLYDADKVKYPFIFYNLELMKLSAYYKQQRQIVILSQTFNPDMYSKFIIRQDYNDGNFPKLSLNMDNIEIGGNAFTGNIYEPLPRAVEESRADATIYDRWLASVGIDNEKIREQVQIQKNCQHIRLSLDGKTIWKDFEKQLEYTTNGRVLAIHDYNIAAVNGNIEAIKTALSYFASRAVKFIATKYPIYIRNGDDWDRWHIFTFATQSSFLIKGIIDDATLIDFATRNFTKNDLGRIQYNVVSASSSENDFLENSIIQIFHQAIFLKSKGLNFSLIYDRNFFQHSVWEKFLDLLNIFLTSETFEISDWSIYTFSFWFTYYLRRLEYIHSREGVFYRSTLEQVRDLNPKLFNELKTYTPVNWKEEHL